MTCHNCKSEAKRFGFFKSHGVKIQRYRCKQCGKSFGDIPARPLDDLRIPEDKAFLVLKALTEGVGIRACSRLFGLHRDSVLRILETAGAKCANFLDKRLRSVTVEEIQFDEIWSYVFTKERFNINKNPLIGDQYTYFGLCRKTKLVVCSLTGKRNQATTDAFVASVAERLNGHTSISTDAYAHYPFAIQDSFRNRADHAAILKCYGTVLENPNSTAHRYSPMQVTRIIVTPKMGNPDTERACTSHIERCNLNLRHFNRRHTRLSIGYSKKLENLKHSIALFFAVHNFCRVHHTLKTTPAVAAGLAERPWTLKELLKAATEC